jgi:rhodanese-related sulfurtransferase
MRRRQGYLLDLVGVAFLAALSFGIGIAVNYVRAQPLSLVYQSPEERLQGQLTRLINAPPFQVTDLQTMGLGEFRQVLQDESALILDARAASLYREGHIPGALNLPREDFAKDYGRLSSTLDAHKDKPIAVYCSGADCHDSKLVASALVSLGFSQVRVFTGGWQGWTEANLPIAR